MKAIFLFCIFISNFTNLHAICHNINLNQNEPIESDSSISQICKCHIDQVIYKAKLLCISPGLNYCYWDTIVNDPIQNELSQLKVIWYDDVLNKCLYLRVIDTLLNDDYLLILPYEAPKRWRLANFYLIKIYGFCENDKKYQKRLLRSSHNFGIYAKLFPEIINPKNIRHFLKQKFKQESNYRKYKKRSFFIKVKVK